MSKETARQMEERAARKRRIEEEDQADLKAGYVAVVPRLGTRLETVVNELLDMKKRGIRGVARFNDKKFYSDTVTMNGAFLEVHKKTKTQWEADMEAFEKRMKKESEDHRNAIPYLMEHYKNRGRRILDEKYWEAWEGILKSSLEGMFKGYELGQTLNLIQALKSYSIEEAKKMFYEQDHSGLSADLVIQMVSLYSEEGKIFADEMLPISLYEVQIPYQQKPELKE